MFIFSYVLEISISMRSLRNFKTTNRFFSKDSFSFNIYALLLLFLLLFEIIDITVKTGKRSQSTVFVPWNYEIITFKQSVKLTLCKYFKIFILKQNR